MELGINKMLFCVILVHETVFIYLNTYLFTYQIPNLQDRNNVIKALNVKHYTR
jgi:hypothetical protein